MSLVHSEALSRELAGIVIRAGRLGFERSRVATALGISADQLALIEDSAGSIAGDVASADVPLDRRPQ